MRFTFLIVLIILFCAKANADNGSDSYQEYKNKIKMGFCNIGGITVSSITDMIRDTNVDMHRLCGNRAECVFDYTLKQMTKGSELSRIIESQYIHEIENKLGIMAKRFPSGTDDMAQLDIRIDIRDGLAINGKPYYSLKYKVTLKEVAESRFGREGHMLLDQWILLGGDYYPEIDTLEEAEMAAIKMVPKIVDKMKETFQDARNYCTVHNLFEH
ncbi:MAG: hypothetical protein NMNS01_23190 [Nitrosomonas sp.]|nr:MAG: hypothetical protein NMNS01_23190 [Nitrosomonas sp.]